jgi:hypothetical protein
MWKGQAPCTIPSPPPPSLSLSLTLSLLVSGVPVGIRLPRGAGRFRNFAGGIPRAMRQVFKEVSISAPKRDTLVV